MKGKPRIPGRLLPKIRAQERLATGFWSNPRALFRRTTTNREIVIEAMRKAVNPFLLGYLKPGDRILEFGVGRRFLKDRVIPLGLKKNWVLTEPDFSALNYEVDPTRRKRGPERERIAASVFRLPFKDESFNGAVASEVLDGLPRDLLPVAAGEIHRVLKPGSPMIHLIGSVPNPRIWNPELIARSGRILKVDDEAVRQVMMTHQNFADGLAGAFKEGFDPVFNDKIGALHIGLRNDRPRMAPEPFSLTPQGKLIFTHVAGGALYDHGMVIPMQLHPDLRAKYPHDDLYVEEYKGRAFVVRKKGE
jgi:SAM-dependent methyltransferase